MANKDFTLCLEGHSGARLRTISKNDIENLRTWKNSKKTTCFLNHDITPEQQEKWYGMFYKQEHDYMFIVELAIGEEWKGIGCMGFRKLENEGCIDAYNIIRALKFGPPVFTMGDAFCLMLAYAASLYDNLPVQSKVLITNPAVVWYEKNHFFIEKAFSNYYLMELNKEAIKKYNLFIKNTII
ncbi:MAG: hypothetical protein ABIT05_16960 [Chitinophagaceae bacterium]